MVEVILTVAARRDLKDIWIDGADRWTPKRADHYLADLEHQIAFLGEFPKMAAVSVAVPSLRRLVVARHAVFYRVSDNCVTVIRILSTRMDELLHLDEAAH